MAFNTMALPASTMASAYRAGQSAGQNYVDIHRETNKYANKPGEINKVAYQAQMAEKKVATEVNKRAKISEMQAQNYADRTDVKLDRDKKIRAAETKTRKAGMLSAVGLLASEAIADGRKPEAPRRERSNFSAYDNILAGQKTKLDADRAKELATPLDISKPTDTSSNASAAPMSSSGKFTGGTLSSSDALAIKATAGRLGVQKIPIVLVDCLRWNLVIGLMFGVAMVVTIKDLFSLDQGLVLK